MSDRKLILSFHDVHPGSRAVCDEFLHRLRGLGVDRVVLLVVPCWHGAAPCSEDAAFAAWLRDRAGEGHEICLHGYYHLVDEITGGRWERAVGRHYTAGEGEFYRIDAAGAAARVRDGLRILAGEMGLPVWGFTPPAWLLGPAARAALVSSGLHYTTRWGSVDLLQGPGPRPAPTLVWSSRTRWRRGCSRAWVRLWGAVQAGRGILRLAVHPADFAHPRVEQSVYAAIERHRDGRTAALYRELLPAGTPPVPAPA